MQRRALPLPASAEHRRGFTLATLTLTALIALALASCGGEPMPGSQGTGSHQAALRLAEGLPSPSPWELPEAKPAPADELELVWPANQQVPIQRAVFDQAPVARPIDPGLVPPNYAHTWIIDVKGMTRFRLDAGNANEILLDFNSDKVTVLDPCQNILQTFTSAADLRFKTIDLTSAAPCKYIDPSNPSRRIYIVLETGPYSPPRTMRLEKLLNIDANTGAEQALVVEDDIYYGTKSKPNAGSFVQGGYNNPTGFQGNNTSWLLPPWAGGSAAGAGNFEVPWREDGWYLVGRNVTYAEAQFYVLLYYNELESKLRAYIYNLSLAKAQGYKVDLFLQAMVANNAADPSAGHRWQSLDGMFFPADVNPRKWNMVSFVLSDWAPNTWSMVEAPFLYPVAKAFNSAGQPTAGVTPPHYSIYEQPFKSAQQNVRIVLSATPFNKLSLSGTIEGKAEGYGDQVMTKEDKSWAKDLIETGKFVYDAVDGGYSWYEKTTGKIAELKKFYEANKDKQSALSFGKAVKFDVAKFVTSVAQGAGGGGAIGAAAAAVGFLSKLLGEDKPQPLKLAISLGVKAKLEAKGEQWLSSAYGQNWFYLPGRFSMKVALKDGLTQNEKDRIYGFFDAHVPRYDRTMGLFGFAHDPTNVELQGFIGDPLNMSDLTCPQSSWPNPEAVTAAYSGWMVLPATEAITDAYEGPKSECALVSTFKPHRRVEPKIELLPVIYNPFAGMTLSGTDAYVKVYENPYRYTTLASGEQMHYKKEPHTIGLEPPAPQRYGVAAWQKRYGAITNYVEIVGVQPTDVQKKNYVISDVIHHWLAKYTITPRDRTYQTAYGPVPYPAVPRQFKLRAPITVREHSNWRLTQCVKGNSPASMCTKRSEVLRSAP